MSNINFFFSFLLFLNFLALFLSSRSFLMLLMKLELIVVNLFFCLVSVLGSDFVVLYPFLALVACESVIGLSVLVKITRSSSLVKSSVSESLS